MEKATTEHDSIVVTPIDSDKSYAHDHPHEQDDLDYDEQYPNWWSKNR
jgi:hypothetical protein